MWTVGGGDPDREGGELCGECGRDLRRRDGCGVRDVQNGDAQRDGNQYALVTVPQWYNPEGGRESAGAGDYVQVRDGSVQVRFIVELVPIDDQHVAVKVTPKTFEHVSGSPQPRELAPDDPNLPPWVLGRGDSLYLAIHKRLQNYAVQ